MRFPFGNTPSPIGDPFADNPALFAEVFEQQLTMMAALWAAGAWDLADDAGRERLIAEGLFELDANGKPGVTDKLFPKAMKTAALAMAHFRDAVNESVKNAERRDAAPRN